MPQSTIPFYVRAPPYYRHSFIHYQPVAVKYSETETSLHSILLSSIARIVAYTNINAFLFVILPFRDRYYWLCSSRNYC